MRQSFHLLEALPPLAKLSISGRVVLKSEALDLMLSTPQWPATYPDTLYMSGGVRRMNEK